MQRSQAARGDVVSQAPTDEAGTQILPSASHPPVFPPHPRPSSPSSQAGRKGQRPVAPRTQPGTSTRSHPGQRLGRGRWPRGHTFPSAEPATRRHRPSRGRAGSSRPGPPPHSANACPSPNAFARPKAAPSSSSSSPPKPSPLPGVGFGPKSQTAFGSALRSPDGAGRGTGVPWVPRQRDGGRRLARTRRLCMKRLLCAGRVHKAGRSTQRRLFLRRFAWTRPLSLGSFRQPGRRNK